MKIRYTPFSERMVIDQPVKGMDFANDVIQTYFMMSLRYRECYYKQRPQGNTVYFMNYPEASLLFYFGLFHMDVLWGKVHNLFTVLMPVVWGVIIAYLLKKLYLCNLSHN